MLTPETIEDMRSSYVKCLKSIETEDKGISEKERKEELDGVKLIMLKIAGYSDEEIS